MGTFVITDGDMARLQKEADERNLCPCGSGEYAEDLYDAKGIYCCKVCDKCRKEKMRGFRAEIFDNPGYETDEPVDPDDEIPFGL